jgi:ubiquinone/menaquinone biosynthesis C-methylase UbiE
MSIHDEARRGFGQGADAYERGRPGYPAKSIRWLERRLELGLGRTVVDVGAGTGKLTRELVVSGAAVLAVEPVPAMRSVLEQAVPQARALDGTAEALPLGNASVDAVVVAQAFHWFDGPAALVEFHRVLRPDGRVALIWNRRLREQPLHRAISEIIEPYRGDTPTHYRGEWRQSIVSTELFTQVDELEVPLEQDLDVDQLVDRVGSTSFIAALPDDQRARVLDRVRDLAAGTGGSVRLGYVTQAYVYERL